MTSRAWTHRLAVLAIALLAGCATAGQRDADTENAKIYDAWRSARSGIEVQASGAIARVLGERGGRSGPHEGFLLHLTGSGGRGLTVRVESNIDIMGNFAVHDGDPAVVRGEYEYDPRGGVIHWTHRDFGGRHPAGFVEINGRLYN
jgi:hypothetical protein